MPKKVKRTYGPPNTVWVVVDSTSGSPILVMRDPPDGLDLMEDEAVYEYELRKVFKA